MSGEQPGDESEEKTVSLWDEREHDAPAELDDAATVELGPEEVVAREPLAGADDDAAPTAVPGSSEPRTTAVTISLSPETLLGVLAAVALIGGSVGPWVVAGIFSVGGTHGDGLITLIAGVVALVPIVIGRWPGLVLASALVAASVAIYDLSRIIPITGSTELFSISLGWGLVLATVASLGLLAVALVGIARTASRPVALATGSIASVIVIAFVALGAAGVFNEEQVDNGSDDSSLASAGPTPTPLPKTTDGMSTASCRTLGISTTGTIAGPCRSDSSGQVVWVAPHGRAATLEGLSAAIESIHVVSVIDPRDGFSDPIEPEGVFVIAEVRVKNTASAPIDLQSDNFALNAGGDLYEPADDSDLTMLDGQLAGGKSLGPGLTRRGEVIFDVPRSRIAALRQSGVLIVAPPEWVDEYDEDVRPTIRIAYLQTRGNVRIASAGGSAAATAPDAADAGSGASDEEAPATRACDQNISAGTSTTCDFASELFKAYAAEVQSGSEASLSVSAYSDAAGRSISMYCEYTDPDVTCTGGDGAYVTFPKWAADVY